VFKASIDVVYAAPSSNEVFNVVLPRKCLLTPGINAILTNVLNVQCFLLILLLWIEECHEAVGCVASPMVLAKFCFFLIFSIVLTWLRKTY